MPRFYGAIYNSESVRVNQGDQPILTLPERIVRMAHEEYAAQGHRQSFDRIQERGGLGAREVIQLLADRVVRLQNELEATQCHKT